MSFTIQIDEWTFNVTATDVDESLGVELHPNGGKKHICTLYTDIDWTCAWYGQNKRRFYTKIRSIIEVGEGKVNSKAVVERYDGKRWVNLIDMPGTHLGVSKGDAESFEPENFQEAMERLFELAVKIIITPPDSKLGR